MLVHAYKHIENKTVTVRNIGILSDYDSCNNNNTRYYYVMYDCMYQKKNTDQGV